MSTLEKLCCESVCTDTEALDIVNGILSSPSYRDRKVYYYDENENENENDNEKKIEKEVIDVSDLIGIGKEILNEMGLKQEKGKRIQNMEMDDISGVEDKTSRTYQADVENAFIRAMACSGYLSQEYKLV